MKTLFAMALTLFGLFGASTFAQNNFEGTITFGIILESEGTFLMPGFQPESYLYTFKGNSVKFHMQGGIEELSLPDVLIDGHSGHTYMLKPAESAAYQLDDPSQVKALQQPKIEKLPGIDSIGAYPCQKYVVTFTDENDVETVYRMWVTDQIHIQPNGDASPMGPEVNIFVPGLPGFPLEVKYEYMGMQMSMFAIDIKKTPIDDEAVSIPKDWQIKVLGVDLLNGR